MTSPGGAEVGRLSVRIVPDSGRFRAELEADLAKINAELKVRVVPDLDTAEIRAQLAALDLKQINLRIDVDGVVEAFVELSDIEALVARLDGRNVRIKIDLDGLIGASAQLFALGVQLEALRATLGSLRGVGGGGGAGGGGTNVGGGFNASSIRRIVRSIVMVGAVSVALVYAGAALTAAWGILSTAIAAVPAALALVGVPILAVVLGLDGIKKAAQAIQPEMDKLKKSVSDVFEKGFTQAFKTLKPLFGSVLTPGFVEVAKSINVVTNALADMTKTKDVKTLLSNIFTGVAVAIQVIRPGILDIVDSFLLLAGRSSAFDALTTTINRFGQAWREQLIDNINNGTLDAAFRNLGELLASTASGLAAFIHNGIEVFATAGDGVTAFFDSLTNFFGKFDWQALGKATGDVFQGLATAFDNVDQGAIDAITGAFQRMGEVFSSPSFTGNLTSIISGLPGVLNVMTNFSSDFVEAVNAIVQAVNAFDYVDTKFREFTKTTEESFLQLGEDLGIGRGTEFADWLNGLNESINRGLGILPPAAEDLGNQTSTAVATGLNSGKPLVDRAAEQLGSTIPTAVKTSLDKVPQIAQSALAPLPPTAQAIFTQLQPVLQGALAGLATTAQLGFASVAAAVATGGPALVAAITTAFVGTDVAVRTAFDLMGVAAQQGLQAVALAITGGFIQIVEPAFTTAFLGIVGQFALLGNDMAVAMTNSMVLVTDAANTGLIGLNNAFINFQTVSVAVIMTAGSLMATAMTNAMLQVNQAAVTGIDTLTLSFNVLATNLGILMGNATINMNIALQGGMTEAQTIVDTSIANMIAALQGAVGAFGEAGSNMGLALANGLRSRQGEVEAAAAALAAAAEAAMRAAAGIHSPSKVWTTMGKFLGKGLARGLDLSIAEVARVATRMANIASGAFSIFTDNPSWLSDMIDIAPSIDTRSSVYSTGPTMNLDDSEFGSVGDKVSDALSGWTVEIDQAGIAKLVNKQNLRNNRR